MDFSDGHICFNQERTSVNVYLKIDVLYLNLSERHGLMIILNVAIYFW